MAASREETSWPVRFVFMRVLQVHNQYRSAGGEDMVVRAEAEMLRTAGNEVRQLLTRNSDRSVRAAAHLILAPWNPLSVRRIQREVREFQPDVTHIHNTWFSLSPAVIHGVASEGIPVVVTLHNYRLTCINGLLYRDGRVCEDCVGRRPWSGVRHACYRGSYTASGIAAATLQLHRSLGTFSDEVDRFVVLTEFQRDLMIRAGLPPDSLTIKPNFVPDPGARSHPPSTSNVVLFVGRLAQEKGARVLVDAWSRVGASDLELWIVGDGPEREELSSSLPPRTKLLGAIPRAEVFELMLKARATVVPSQCYEGFPMSVVESMAAGLPVLTSALGPFTEIGERLGENWIVDGRTQNWEDALSILENPNAVDEAGLKTRRVFEESYSPERNLQQLTEIYANV